MANQNIQLKDQSGNQLFPRTKWKNIVDAPKMLPNPGTLTINGQDYDGTIDVDIIVKGGSDIKLSQTTGASTTEAMSQNAVTTEITRLEKLIEDYHYVPISITSMTITPSVAEIGSTVPQVMIKWSLSGAAATAITVNNTQIADLHVSTLAVVTPVKTNTTYSMTVTDARNHTANRSVTLPFYWKVHWGTSSVTGNLDSAFVLQLASNAISNTRVRTLTVTAKAGEYIYYALPTAYGTPTFNVGGFDGGFSAVASITHTNAYNQTVPFTIYRSDNAGLGTQTVKIS